jgi:hypothetical protein
MLSLALLGPAGAGALDTPACKRDLHLASVGVTEAMARLKGLAKVTGEEKCAAYRQQFLTVVRARNVVATCKTGPDRDADVGRLDGTIEDLNGGIAESCTAQ